MAATPRIHSTPDARIAPILANAAHCMHLCGERLDRSHELGIISAKLCVVSRQSVARSREILAAIESRAQSHAVPYRLLMPASPQPIANGAPSALVVTDYDRAHVTTYLRLLDSESAGVSWEASARAHLAVEPRDDPERARRRFDSHVARARWIASQGYWDQLKA